MLKPVINSHYNFTEKEAKKLLSVIPYLEKAINSQEYRQWCVNYDFENAYDLGMNGLDVYNHQMNGREVLNKEDDREMDIDLTIYTVPWYGRGKNVIGYTYPSTLRTWVNRKYFLSMDIAGICGNLFHEWCHKIGFDHSFYWTPTREKSVPYACGYKIEEIVRRMLRDEVGT